MEDCLSKEMRPDFMGLEKLYNPSIIKAQIDFDNFEIVAISTWKIILLMTILIKFTLDNIFIKVKKIRQGGATVTKQLIYFSNADNSTTLTPSGPPGVSREVKLSTDFDFGSLVR